MSDKNVSTPMRALWWWDDTVVSLGLALTVRCWPAHSKLRADPRDFSEGLGLLSLKVEGTAQWRDNRLLQSWPWYAQLIKKLRHGSILCLPCSTNSEDLTRFQKKKKLPHTWPDQRMRSHKLFCLYAYKSHIGKNTNQPDQARALWWWANTVCSLGWALNARCWPARSKLGADLCYLSESLGLLGPKVEEQRKPPSLHGGGITGCCSHSPICRVSLVLRPPLIF
ncbi:hypothetical protein V8G54_020157 [Vigna mungo]|uniref:Uncharacterized protein n=1 Tax=Vigna mungo TaxID=3915 RepID=A0AAQ3RWF4_VIGMU